MSVTVHGQRPWTVTPVLTHNLTRNRNRDTASTSMNSRTDLALLSDFADFGVGSNQPDQHGHDVVE